MLLENIVLMTVQLFLQLISQIDINNETLLCNVEMLRVYNFLSKSYELSSVNDCLELYLWLITCIRVLFSNPALE